MGTEFRFRLLPRAGSWDLDGVASSAHVMLSPGLPAPTLRFGLAAVAVAESAAIHGRVSSALKRDFLLPVVVMQ